MYECFQYEKLRVQVLSEPMLFWKLRMLEILLDKELTANCFLETHTKLEELIPAAMVKGVLHPWALFLKTLCIFSKNKATLDKVSYGSGQKYSKELKNHSFTSVETIVCEVTVKNVRKSIFSMFWAINQ